jgi:hypothetical protein
MAEQPTTAPAQHDPRWWRRAWWPGKHWLIAVAALVVGTLVELLGPPAGSLAFAAVTAILVAHITYCLLTEIPSLRAPRQSDREARALRNASLRVATEAGGVALLVTTGARFIGQTPSVNPWVALVIGLMVVMLLITVASQVRIRIALAVTLSVMLILSIGVAATITAGPMLDLGKLFRPSNTPMADAPGPSTSPHAGAAPFEPAEPGVPTEPVEPTEPVTGAAS